MGSSGRSRRPTGYQLSERGRLLTAALVAIPGFLCQRHQLVDQGEIFFTESGPSAKQAFAFPVRNASQYRGLLSCVQIAGRREHRDIVTIGHLTSRTSDSALTNTVTALSSGNQRYSASAFDYRVRLRGPSYAGIQMVDRGKVCSVDLSLSAQAHRPRRPGLAPDKAE